MMIKLNS